jgi:hypothetical protein
LNPSEIERLDLRPWYLYRLPDGVYRWLTVDLPERGWRFVFSTKAPTVGEAIEEAKAKGKLP